MEIFPVDIEQFICEKDLMKNFKADSALQRKLICESLCSLCCPELIWGREEESVPWSYCQVYRLWVSQDKNILRQLKALEQAVFRWSSPVRASAGQIGRESLCLQCPHHSSFWSSVVSSDPGYPKINLHRLSLWRSLLLSTSQKDLVSFTCPLVYGSQMIQICALTW